MTREVPVAILLFAGVALLLLSVVGLVVMRETLDRLHCIGCAAFGALLVGIAITVEESFSLIGNKALAGGVFVLVSGVVLTHITARAVRVHELDDWRIQPDEEVEVEGR
ncbi:MAG TPA: monovalent cation/H(+) antiporter subunit G [Candidatus Dormibacteraeota bacterium]|nr:monovalent cation/H(+) antiporter subunit G [Candidatus Dormibacteraeota bacterium]